MHDQDIKIAVACVQKDEHAWSELISTYKRDCMIIARKYHVSYCFNDVFSEFILKLLGKPGQTKGALERYNGSSSLKTYLSVIFSHVVLSHHRKMKTRGFIIFSDEPEKLQHQKEPEAIEDDSYEELLEAIALIPENERNLIELYYYQELKLRQIADIFQCSKSKISRQLKKIHEKLKKFLQQN